VARPDERDKRLCLAAAQRLAQRRDGGVLRAIRHPDNEDRTDSAIDLIAEDDIGAIAVEHTVLETFEGQTTDNVRFQQLLGDMTDRIGDTLPTPGHYHLAVPVEGVAGVKSTDRVKSEIAAWVRDKAPTLPIPSIPPKEKNSVAGVPPDAPLPMVLRRFRDGPQGVVWCVRATPEDLAELSVLRARTALGHKARELEVYRSQGATTILLLEIQDFVLTNAGAVATAVETAAKHFDGPLPDLIVAVETVGMERETIIKDGSCWPFSTP
jgi:hypothetical protein